jgi:uncharacterized membrane protein YqiK
MFTFLLAALAALLGAVVLAFLTGAVRYIPNNRVGVVEKLWSPSGSLSGGFIALSGEAGYQPDVLRGGWHFFVPLQYRVHSLPLVTIGQGRIGYVFARDGAMLGAAQSLASNAVASDFEDTRGFLAKGGQRGPQRRLLREGTYAINLAQFAVFTDETTYALPLDKGDAATFKRMAELISTRGGFEPVILRGGEDRLGVVTVHDGRPLPQGELIAPAVDTANNFQDADAFVAAGGYRGRQLAVLVEGTWYLNRLFATVELIPKTVVEVGTVGVVVSYTGGGGADVSGDDYKHGELVATGERGVWSTPLLPGKYAFNTCAGKVVAVPTTNFILKWMRSEVGSHRYDENLAEVNLITRDAFEPSLPLSVVVHIGYREAPLVVQRFGDIKRLVEQTLDPMVAAYFKNIGQTRTLIELIHDRSEIQRTAGEEMREKFDHYNLVLEEVLIGTPGSAAADGPIERMLTQIRARQIADEQVETYGRQEKAAVKERELREAEARANQQTALTQSELGIVIQGNEGRAAYERAVQQAAQIRALASAEAEKAARIGIAQALAAEEQVRAYGGPRFQVTQQVMTRFAEAIERSGVEVVPRIVMGGNGGNAMDALLATLLDARLDETAAAAAPRSAEALALREELQRNLLGPMAK